MVYEYEHWGPEGGRSGDGSSLAASASDRAFLLDALTDFQISSVFDAGCGSMHWQPELLRAYEALGGGPLTPP